jgi:rhodanese-related sulfurtransferase
MKIFKPVLIFLLLSITQLSIATELVNVDPKQLQSMQDQKNALVIDIRTIKEWNETGTIPRSEKLEFFNAEGQFNAELWIEHLNNLRQSPDQPIILVCRSGNRSGKVGNYLTQQLGMNNIYHLQNGMNGWLKEGNKTEKDCSTSANCDKPQP